MSSDRPFYFFELSGKSEVVLGWKILFGTIYRNTWGMDFPPQNEIWTRNSPFFFEPGWDTEVVFGCSITDWTVYRHTFRKDWGPKDGIWVQTDLCFFFESGWDTEVVFGCSITDWTVYRHTFRKDCTSTNEIWTRNSPFIFSSQAGNQRLFCGEKFCSELYIDIREEWIFATKQDMNPDPPPLFFRAKRGFRGRFGVKNPIRNCI